jgi:hypothetical protein
MKERERERERERKSTRHLVTLHFLLVVATHLEE